MKKIVTKTIIILGLGFIFICGMSMISGDWEETGKMVAYFYEDEYFYDLNGMATKNNNDCGGGFVFDFNDYNQVKIECNIAMKEGAVEYITLEDENENVIKKWNEPTSSFAEELERDVFEKMKFSTQKGSKGAEGTVTVVIYGRPKLLTIIKREIRFILL